MTDYWRLVVTNNDKPDGIKVDSTNAIVAPCTINFYSSASPISDVDIYEFRWRSNANYDTESVQYDKAICLRFHDGKSLCIACQLDGPGIATEVHLSDDQKTIAALIEGTRLRLSIAS